jgi:hypothetical protein
MFTTVKGKEKKARHEFPRTKDAQDKETQRIETRMGETEKNKMLLK